jgi:hypothetical protein
MLALDNDFKEAVKLLTPFLNVYHTLPPSLKDNSTPGTQKGSFLHTMQAFIKFHVEAIRSSHQCSFVGEDGGVVGKSVFPTKTMKRPQITFDCDGQNVSVDNIFYWKALSNCYVQTRNARERATNVHNAMSTLGYESNFPSMKADELDRLNALVTEFQYCRGKHYDRLRNHFEWRVQQAKNGKLDCAFITPLLSLNEKQRLQKWEMATFNELMRLVSQLEEEISPPTIPTLEAYDALVGATCKASNPLMVSVVTLSRTAKKG